MDCRSAASRKMAGGLPGHCHFLLKRRPGCLFERAAEQFGTHPTGLHQRVIDIPQH